MSDNWVKDIKDMHTKFGVRPATANLDTEMRKAYLKFRIDFLQEELDETRKAFEEGDPEEIVDGLIDLCVVAIGTLDAYQVDAHRAWDNVLTANMAKEVGVKASRPNPFGLPDLVKPEGWTAPSHKMNHGLFASTFNHD